MPWPLPALLAALSFVAAPARPTKNTIEVRWHAPPTCPDEASVRAAIERLVGRPLAKIRDRRLSLIATVYPAGAEWSLTIYTVAADGTQERTLRYSHGCALLAEAAAVLIAMTIDPQVLGRLDAATLKLVTEAPEASPEAPADPPADPPAPVPTPTAEPPLGPSPAPPVAPVATVANPAASTPPGPRIKSRGAVRLAGSLGWGDLPSIGGGLGLALALRRGRFQAEISGGGWFLRSVKLDLPGSSGAMFDLWSLGARAGYVARAGRRLEVPLLLGLEAGQIHVRGVRLVEAGNDRTPWVAVVFSPGLSIVVHKLLAVVIGLDLVVPATRPRFVVENVGEIFRPSPIGLRGTLGLEFRFPTR